MAAVRRGFQLLAVALGLGYVVASSYVMAFEDSLIYFPERGGRSTDRGQDVWLTTADGVRLHARSLVQPSATLTLLYLHGNAGNLAGRSELLEYFAALGVNVFALDYRGYGHSAGTPSEAGLYRDAETAHAWLARHAPAQRIVVLGESLGGGPACQLARDRPVAGLVLQSTFTSVPDMAALAFPWLPTRLVVRTRFDNLGKVPHIRVPKLFVHSRRDEMIPFAMAERLFSAAAPPKQRLCLSRSLHNDVSFVEGAELASGLRAFFASL